MIKHNNVTGTLQYNLNKISFIVMKVIKINSFIRVLTQKI